MKRPQYVFRPNLSDPQHRRAWVLLQQMPSARRKEFLVQSILAAEQTDRLEKSIRKVVREELQAVNICSRNFLLASAWNITVPIQTRTVDVHIAKLRKKLDLGPDDLKTVTRQGYALST